MRVVDRHHNDDHTHSEYHFRTILEQAREREQTAKLAEKQDWLEAIKDRRGEVIDEAPLRQCPYLGPHGRCEMICLGGWAVAPLPCYCGMTPVCGLYRRRGRYV